MKEDEGTQSQVGSVVEQAIVNSSKELEEEKKRIKSETYDDI